MRTSDAPPRLGLDLAAHGHPITAEEFADADFQAPWRYEREQGRLLVMAPDGQDHDDTAEPWRNALVIHQAFTRPNRIQKVKSEAWVRVDGGTDRIADLGVYLFSDQPVPPIPDRVPDLIFEIVSPGRDAVERDYVAKRADYFRLGVREYVIIERFRQVGTVLTCATDDDFEHLLTPADAYTSPLLPGLFVPLAEVLGR